MSEFEIGEMLYNAYNMMVDNASIYFTIVSAYFVMSYLVGNKLSTSQITVVTALYVIWCAILVNVQYLQLSAVRDLQLELRKLGDSPLVLHQNTEVGSWAFILVQIVGLLASLFFTWSVRHRKSD